MSNSIRPINFNIAIDLVQELDDIAKAMQRNRTQVILHAINKSMAGLREEASKAVHHRLLREREHGSWAD